MIQYVVIGVSGIYKQFQWNVKGYQDLDAASQQADKLNREVEDMQMYHQDFLNEESFNQALMQRIYKLDPAAIVYDGFVEYYVDTLELQFETQKGERETATHVAIN